MDTSSKQRLIGVGVLVALAIVVLPILFHHSSKTELALNIPQDAPPPPPVSNVQIAPPTQNTPKTALPPSSTSVVNAEKPVVKPMRNDTITQYDSEPGPEFKQRPLSIKSVHVLRRPAPSKPKVKAAAQPRKKATQKTIAISAKQVAKTPVVQQQKSVAKTTKKPKSKAVWLVQLGSFKNEANAKTLVARLTEHGYKAHSKTIKTGQTTITKVYIGPEYKHESADWIKRKLAKTLKIKSIIVRQS